jgi:hypothetical protein
MEKLISWTQDICQQIKIQKKDCTYKGHLEMNGTHLICSNFINFRLNIKQLLAQHISLLGYTSLPTHCKLPDGFREPFFRCMGSCRCSFLPLLKHHTHMNIALHAGALSTNRR